MAIYSKLGLFKENLSEEQINSAVNEMMSGTIEQIKTLDRQSEMLDEYIADRKRRAENTSKKHTGAIRRISTPALQRIASIFF